VSENEIGVGWKVSNWLSDTADNAAKGLSLMHPEYEDYRKAASSKVKDFATWVDKKTGHSENDEFFKNGSWGSAIRALNPAEGSLVRAVADPNAYNNELTRLSLQYQNDPSFANRMAGAMHMAGPVIDAVTLVDGGLRLPSSVSAGVQMAKKAPEMLLNTQLAPTVFKRMVWTAPEAFNGFIKSAPDAFVNQMKKVPGQVVDIAKGAPRQVWKEVKGLQNTVRNIPEQFGKEVDGAVRDLFGKSNGQLVSPLRPRVQRLSLAEAKTQEAKVRAANAAFDLPGVKSRSAPKMDVVGSETNSGQQNQSWLNLDHATNSDVSSISSDQIKAGGKIEAFSSVDLDRVLAFDAQSDGHITHYIVSKQSKIEGLANLGVKIADQKNIPLLSAIHEVASGDKSISKADVDQAYHFAISNREMIYAHPIANANPDVIEELQHGAENGPIAVSMADAAHINQPYYNPLTGAKGTRLSGGGPGYANRWFDPRRFKQNLAWTLMQEHDARNILSRAGDSKLLATYKAFQPETILGSHGYLAIGPEMEAAGMTMNDILEILHDIKLTNTNAVNWKAVYAESDLSSIFHPRWSTFHDRKNLYKALFDGGYINGVHWKDVADILESPITKGYRPGELMNIIRVGDQAVHHGGSWHDTYAVGIPGVNEGFVPGKLNILDLFGSTNRKVKSLKRSLQMGGKHDANFKLFDPLIDRKLRKL
jgi:hypothetical protein